MNSAVAYNINHRRNYQYECKTQALLSVYFTKTWKVFGDDGNMRRMCQRAYCGSIDRELRTGRGKEERERERRGKETGKSYRVLHPSEEVGGEKVKLEGWIRG